jgi:iron complex outermembrane receptor protein
MSVARAWLNALLAVAYVTIPWLLYALLCADSAEAEEVLPESEAPVVVMEPVQVRGQKIENIEDVKAQLARRPGSNIIIEEKEIRESRALNLEDALRFAPGVRFQSRFGADEGQFQIRGTSLRNNFHHRGINILINGIFFGDADGFSDFESIELLAYERIEVYKGANALRYGANTIGGAINFVPRTGYNASMLQMRAQGGSYGLVMGQVSSGRVTQPFRLLGNDATSDYYISVSGNRQDGFQDNSQQARQRVNANFGLQLGDHQEIRLYILQANVSERIPGSLTTAQLYENPQQVGGITPGATNNFFACGTNNAACKNGRYYNQQRVGVAYHNEFATNQVLEIVPYFSYQYLDHPIFQTIRQDNYNIGGEIRYVNTNALFGHNNFFVIGHQPRYGDQHQRRFEQQDGSILRQSQNAYFRTTYFGTYAEDAFDATEKLTLVAGGRWDYTGRQGNVQSFGVFPPAVPFCPGALTNPSCPSGVETTQQPLRHFDSINPKLGFVYRTTATSQLYFNASRAYEAPLNLELTSSVNPDGSLNTGFLGLDAQRAWQFELGHRGTSADKRYTWDFTVYDLEMRKEILAANIIPAAGGAAQGTFLNANDTRHTGIEAGGAMVLTRGIWATGPAGQSDTVTLRGAYTWSLFMFLDDVRGNTVAGPNTLIAQAGNRVAGAPEHSIATEIRYDHPAGWWVAPQFEWVPTGYYVDNLNTVKNPSYFVLHIRSGWNVSKNLTLYAEGRNLTDKTYAGAVVVNDALNRYANPALGISGFAGAEWRF